MFFINKTKGEFMKFLNTGFFITIDSNKCQLSTKAFKHVENALLDKIKEKEIKDLNYELYKKTIGKEHFLKEDEVFKNYLDIEEDLVLSFEHECGLITLVTEEEYDEKTKESIIKNVIAPIVKQFIKDYSDEPLFLIDVGYNDKYEEIEEHHIKIN